MDRFKRTTTVLSAVAIAAVLVAPFALARGHGGDDGHVRMTLIEKGTAFHFIDVKAPAADGQAGDLITFESTLHKQAHGPAVGSLEGSCIQIRADGTLDDCDVTVSIGKRSFRMAGPFDPASGGTLSILGGTGDWVGAGGTDRITNHPDGTATHVINLLTD